MEKITVKMTKESLYDFFLYHAYSKLSGFLVNVLGLSVFFIGAFSYGTGKIGGAVCGLYVVFSLILLCYTPVSLKLRAANAVKRVPYYQEPIDMTFSDTDGIVRSQGGKQTVTSWDKVVKAAVTPKTIAVYISEEEAIVIPKTDFGDSFNAIFMMIARQLGRQKMRLI
ncbi:YcxB-like protein [Lachnospiraceae bacterium]|nr:YcxB-like protein [Lachnospiraceae bacterium]